VHQCEQRVSILDRFDCLIFFVEDFGLGAILTVSYYRFNTDRSIRMLKIASSGLDWKRAKSLGTLETSDFRGFLSIRG
jgi:hypothetical protein